MFCSIATPFVPSRPPRKDGTPWVPCPQGWDARWIGRMIRIPALEPGIAVVSARSLPLQGFRIAKPHVKLVVAGKPDLAGRPLARKLRGDDYVRFRLQTARRSGSSCPGLAGTAPRARVAGSAPSAVFAQLVFHLADRGRQGTAARVEEASGHSLARGFAVVVGVDDVLGVFGLEDVAEWGFAGIDDAVDECEAVVVQCLAEGVASLVGAVEVEGRRSSRSPRPRPKSIVDSSQPYCGFPSSAFCSQTYRARESLRSTTTVMGSRCWTRVASSPSPMDRAPSPTNAITGRSGCANWAPMA